MDSTHTHDASKKLEVSAENKIRMHTLRGMMNHLEEQMAAIVLSTVGKPLKPGAAMPKIKCEGEVCCFRSEDGCGCYDFANGICYPC